MNRLFDHDHMAPQIRECALRANLLPELAERPEVVEVLVTIERDEPLAIGLARQQIDQRA